MNVETLLDDTAAFFEESMNGLPIKPILTRAKSFVTNALNPKCLIPYKEGIEERIKVLESEIASIEEQLRKQAEAKAISEARAIHAANVEKIYKESIPADYDATFPLAYNTLDVDHANQLKELRKRYSASIVELKQLLQISQGA